MTKKNIVLLLAALIPVLLLLYYFFGDTMKSVKGDPWAFVPEESALVLELDQPGMVFDKWNNENALAESLSALPEFTKLLTHRRLLDSLLTSKPTLLQNLNASRLLLSVAFDTLNHQPDLVLISHIQQYINLTDFRHFLSKELGNTYAVIELDVAGYNVLKILNGVTNQMTCVAYDEGNLMLSFGMEGITKALAGKTLAKKHFSAQSDWRALRATSGKHVDARLYIQYSYFSRWLASISSDMEKNKAAWLSHFSDWTETDVILKKDQLLMAGFTLSDSTSFLSGFQDQKPAGNTCFNLSPFNTNLLLSYGFSDFLSWYNSPVSTQNQFRSTGSNRNELEKIASEVGTEVALVSNAEQTSGYLGGTWVLVKSKDKAKMAAYLRRLAENKGKSPAGRYNGYVISYISDASFLPGLFGEVFPAFAKNYYTFIDDFAVFANSETSLINLLGYYETGKTLDLNDNFKSFSNNLASESNILLYFKPGSLMGRVSEFTNQFTSRKLQISEQVVDRFQGVALQFSAGHDLTYTNFYVKHATEVREENLAVWKASLDNEIIHKPILVSNHRDENQNIVVFDDTPAVYLIDSDGDVLWKQRLEGKPFGEIFEVDYFKNGKVQYLFNTTSHLYLMDVQGRAVASYPKKLHLFATNPLSVFDYSGSKDYRLLVAQSDKKVNNFSIDGREIAGWDKPHMQDLVSEPVTRLVINGKDYIITTDINGRVKIVDRQGNERISVAGKFAKARNSHYHINRTNSKGIILTTNTVGKLVYISATGNIKTTDFGNFSPDHFFLYEDFNGDGVIDFIFVDGRELKVFDRFKKLIFSYTFGSEITLRPEFFSLGKRQKVLGVVANSEKTIYLFDNKGNTIISSGLVGETPFTVGSVGNDRKINLISAAGNTLYNYRIK